MAVLGAYYLTIPNVTAESIGVILLIGNLAGFLFEIPSGYLSDKMGHKKALVFSRVLMTISSLIFLLADSLTLLILATSIFSIAVAFLSGTGTAFMHETLDALGKSDKYTEIMGKIRSISFVVPLILSVMVPFMVEVSFKLPFLVAVIVDLIGLVIAMMLVSPKVPQVAIDEIKATNFRQVIAEGYKIGFFKYAFFSIVLTSFVFGVVEFGTPYKVLLDVPIIYYGVFFGLGRILASILLAYSGKIKKHFTITSFFRFQTLLFFLLMLSLGVSANPIIVVCIFILVEGFRWGLTQIETGFMLEIIKGSKFKATLLSTKSQLWYFAGALVGYSMGYSIERISYQDTYLYAAIVMVGILTPLWFYIVRSEKKMRLITSSSQ